MSGLTHHDRKQVQDAITTLRSNMYEVTEEDVDAMTLILDKFDANRDTFHELTAHKTQVKRVRVTPRDATPPYFEETETVTIDDCSDDTGGCWYSCSCGEDFEDAENAYDHLVEHDAAGS